MICIIRSKGNQNSKIAPTASEFVAKLAIIASARVNIWLYVFFILLSYSALMFAHIYRLENSLKSYDVSFSQAYILGDMFSISTYMQSIRSSGAADGMWLVDASNSTIIHENSNLELSCQPKSGSSQYSARFCDRRILISVKHPVLSSAKNAVAFVIATTEISNLALLIIPLLLAVPFGASSVLLYTRFKSIGKMISDPIISFSETIRHQTSLSEPVSIPLSTSFSEEAELYSKFKSLMNQLQKMQDLEKEAAIGRITSQLSHDLRAPLASIERILHSPDDTALSHHKSTIRESLYRLNAMIESLRRTDLELMISTKPCGFDSLSGLRFLESKAANTNVTLDFQVDQSLPKFLVDSEKCERAWVNLVSNAIDFARSKVRLEFESIGRDLIFRVIDDGPGIPTEFLPMLFQRGATYGKPDGTGLGLAYVRQIMRGHGGDVTYRRENGLTIFECRLPNAVASARENSMEKQRVDAPVKSLDRKKLVAICFKPESLNHAILTILDSQKAENFHFSCEYVGAEVVATNDPDIALDAIEDGKEPLEFSASLQEAAIIDRLKRRFHLV
jgi:signal transduction histidine kinase